MSDRIELEVQNIVLTGLEPDVITSDADGHFFENDSRTFLYVQAVSGEAVVTVTPGLVRSGLNLETLDVTVPNGETRMIGPFPVSDFNQAGSRQVLVDVDVNDTAIAAIRLA